MTLRVVLDERRRLIRRDEPCLDLLAIRLRPDPDRQLSDDERVLIRLIPQTENAILVRAGGLDQATEAAVPWLHRLEVVAADLAT